MTGIVWFREDLRIQDNTALHYASVQHPSLLAIYFITPKTWLMHDMAACKVGFMLRALQALQKSLASFNIPLLVFQCPTFNEIPSLLGQIVDHFQVTHVYANKQYEVNEIARDANVQQWLVKHKVKFLCYDDQTIIAPDKLKTGQGGIYTVFTPYKKTWLKEYVENPVAILPRLKKKVLFDTTTLQHPQQLSIIPSHLPEFVSSINDLLWPADETAAHKQLEQFVTHKIKSYQDERDFPALAGTSQISPYLASGLISSRMCLHAALQANKQQLFGGNPGIECWISELIWREFYKSILVHFPRVCKNRAFKLETDKLHWHDNPAHLTAWQQGQTGFPLVDAAMRQLNQTGWMHNRLRMVTAMFFSKLLWLDWRLGERYFMQHLIDGDFAANNGGWQWSASTGTDAAPYFRIFNPITQSERFDPSGDFIRKYCPELASLDNKTIHDPYTYSPIIASSLNYPAPIIDYKTCREYAIQAFKQL